MYKKKLCIRTIYVFKNIEIFTPRIVNFIAFGTLTSFLNTQISLQHHKWEIKRGVNLLIILIAQTVEKITKLNFNQVKVA